MLVGYISVTFVLLRLASRAGFEPHDALDLSIYAFLSGIIGTRILFIFLNFGYFSANPKEIFDFQAGGLTWYGGPAAGLLCVYLFCRLKKYPIGQGMDLVFTPLILGLAIGRIGCFLNGCCYGKPCDLPWAMTFPHHSHPVPVHPTQIYEMILDLALLGFLLFWWGKRKFAGENTLLSFGLYGAVRFFVEFFRYNSPDMMWGALSLAQWAGLAMFIVLLGIVLYKRSKVPKGKVLEPVRVENVNGSP